MSKAKRLKPHKLTNGKSVLPPRKGEPWGEWVESDRRPTDTVEFAWHRFSPVLARFYDDVCRIRMLADGTIELDHTLMVADANVDVRDALTTNAEIALISVGAHAARALREAIDRRLAAKKPRVGKRA